MILTQIILTSIIGCYILLITIAIVGFYRQWNKDKIGLEKNNPIKISIIIAIRNEQDTIAKCIRSILNQSYSEEDFEIILVDDHSNDATVTMVKPFQLTNKNITLIQLQEKFGKKQALQMGVKKAKFEVIATTDADCILPVNWLYIAAQKFKTKTDLLIGPIQFSSNQGFLNVFQQLDMFAMQGITFGFANFNKPILNNAANLFFNKHEFLDSFSIINNKHPSGDDVFLLEQLKSNKKKITCCLNENFIVTTKPESNFDGFFNQRLRWASKSKFYKDTFLKFTSILTLLTNSIVIFIYYHLMFIDTICDVYIILLVSKWLIDFILLFLASSFYKNRKLMCYFIPVQLVYPIYIFAVGILSMVVKFKWKERIYNA